MNPTERYLINLGGSGLMQTIRFLIEHDDPVIAVAQVKKQIQLQQEMYEVKK